MSRFEEFLDRYGVGDVVTGQVTKVLPFGALVEVTDGVPGLLVDDELRPPVGARVPMRITSIDRARRRVAFAAP